MGRFLGRIKKKIEERSTSSGKSTAGESSYESHQSSNPTLDTRDDATYDPRDSDVASRADATHVSQSSRGTSNMRLDLKYNRGGGTQRKNRSGKTSPDDRSRCSDVVVERGSNLATPRASSTRKNVAASGAASVTASVNTSGNHSVSGVASATATTPRASTPKRDVATAANGRRTPTGRRTPVGKRTPTARQSPVDAPRRGSNNNNNNSPPNSRPNSRSSNGSNNTNSNKSKEAQFPEEQTAQPTLSENETSCSESYTVESVEYTTSGSYTETDVSLISQPTQTSHANTADASVQTFDTLDHGEDSPNNGNATAKIEELALERRSAVVDPSHQAIVQVSEHGGVDKLLLQELCHIPRAKNSEDVVVKVECSSITLQDCMIRRGKWYDMQTLPFVPGSDIVGTVHELGRDAVLQGGLRVGDRIAAAVHCGGNAKYITIPYDNVITVPSGVDPVDALCLSSTYVPAREALDLGRKYNTPYTGANILVVGGNGPSGLATIELAVLEGANVFTTADERHHEYLSRLGAKCYPIDPCKWLPHLRGKMDAVLDSVCLDSYESSLMALNEEGVLVCTGLSAVYTQGQIRAFGLRDVRNFKAMYVKMRAKYLLNKTVYYDKMERYKELPSEYAQHFKYLCHITSKGLIKPTVAARASLNMVAFMHKAIEHGDTPYGVCVCTPWITKYDSKDHK